MTTPGRTCCATVQTTTGGGSCHRVWGHKGMHWTWARKEAIWWGNSVQLGAHEAVAATDPAAAL